MRFLNLALKDLSQIFHEKRTLMFLILMPVLFTVFMGFATRGSGQNADPRLALGWLNRDPDGFLSQTLYDALSKSDSVRLVKLDGDQVNVDEQVRTGKLAGALIVPQNYTQQTLAQLGQAGDPAQLVLVTDELSANGQTLQTVVRGELTRLMSAAEISSLAAEESVRADDQPQMDAFRKAIAGWESTEGTGLSFTLQRAEGGTAQTAIADNPYNQTSPGILVMFAVFGLVTSAGILVQERKTGTLQRLVTTSMSRAEIIAGHMLAMFAIGFLQSIVLVVFGQFLLHVDYFRQPLAILLVLVGLGVWVAALGLLIGVLAKGEDQVVLFSLIAMFLFSGLGGTWFPLENSGAGFAAVGRLVPSYWAMQGLQNILVRGLDLSSVLLPAGLMVGFGLVIFGAALWKFRVNA